MIKRLQEFSNLGTPDFIFELVKCLESFKSKGVNCTFSDLVPLFTNQKIDGISRIDGCISLAIAINFVTNKGGYLDFPASISALKNDKKKLSKKFVELLFEKLLVDVNYPKIFSNEFMSFDSSVNAYIIKNSAFSFKYSRLRQLLLDFDFLIKHPVSEINAYLINSEYKSLFVDTFKHENNKRKISVDEFNLSMEQKRIYGEEAESFVMDFEESRLNMNKSIEWVAKYIVNAGYDIASYDNDDDDNTNRFIEVKSYTGNDKYFYLSSNEYKTAKRRRQKYWLYLVNRDKLADRNYAPTMIQDPYINVFTSNDWEMESQNWKFKQIN